MTRHPDKRERGWIAATFGLLILCLSVAWLIAWFVTDVLNWTMPAADTPQQQWERQNVIKDPRTGCQYIRIDRGGTPRLDKDGRPMCR